MTSRSQPSGPGTSTAGMSRTDRIVLWLEHEGNKRLRRLGTALLRRSNGVGPRGRNVLILTTRGRRSGRDHAVLLQFFPDGESMIVVAANSGRAAQPDWYVNLLATPTARIEIRGRVVAVHAEPLPAHEATAFWPSILRRAPTYARYRAATSRTIPLVRLQITDKTADADNPG